MQIIVDTKKDSPQEIRKIISFLNSFLGEHQEQETPDVQPGMFNMFNDNSDYQPSEDSEPKTPEDGEKKDYNLETY